MPTSSGFDRTNYGTTLNFSRYGAGHHHGGGAGGGMGMAGGAPPLASNLTSNSYHHYQQKNPPPTQTQPGYTRHKSNPNVSFASSTPPSNANSQTSSQSKFFPSGRSNGGHSYKQYYVASKNLKSSSTASSPNVAIHGVDHPPGNDPFSVNIRDPNLRELVQKLVKVNDNGNNLVARIS